MSLLKPLSLWFAIALLVIVLDQWTKVLATDHLECISPSTNPVCNLEREQKSVVLTSWFKFRLAHNYGAAFSFLHDANGWQRVFFSVLAILVSLALSVWIVRTVQHSGNNRWCELLALSFILGGAIGNVYDRIVLGYVIDFIAWHYQEHYFPTFNIADSAICTGAGLLIFDMVFLQRKQEKEAVT